MEMDHEPVSVGVSALIGGLLQLAQHIREVSRNVLSNREDCVYLAEHIEEVVGFISRLEAIALADDVFTKTIIGLYDIMIECLEFMKLFLDASKIRQILKHKEYKRRFEYFNRRIDQYKFRLMFGIHIYNFDPHSPKLQPSVPRMKPPPTANNAQRIPYRNHFMRKKQLSVNNSDRHKHVYYPNNQMIYPYHLMHNYYGRRKQYFK